MDVIPVIFVVGAITLQSMTDRHDVAITQWQRYLNATASFFIWFKFLYFFRVFRLYGHLIKTITEVIIDIRVFVVILVLSNLAFSGTFYILSKNSKESKVTSYGKSITMTYELMLGQFDTEKYGDVGETLIYIVFVFSSLFLIVIMLNLLIAIISDTFATVQGQAKRKMYQEFAELICENYHLVTKEIQDEYDNQGNYLFCSQIQQAGNSCTDNAQHPEGIYQERLTPTETSKAPNQMKLLEMLKMLLEQKQETPVRESCS